MMVGITTGTRYDGEQTKSLWTFQSGNMPKSMDDLVRLALKTAAQLARSRALNRKNQLIVSGSLRGSEC